MRVNSCHLGLRRTCRASPSCRARWKSLGQALSKREVDRRLLEEESRTGVTRLLSGKLNLLDRRCEGSLRFLGMGSFAPALSAGDQQIGGSGMILLRIQGRKR